jgi:hypothetical protein
MAKLTKILMGKLNAYQKWQILISFSIQTLSHTFINNLNCRSLANKMHFQLTKILYNDQPNLATAILINFRISLKYGEVFSKITPIQSFIIVPTVMSRKIENDYFENAALIFLSI